MITKISVNYNWLGESETNRNRGNFDLQFKIENIAFENKYVKYLELEKDL